MFPSYTNVLNVYAFCNLHDASRPGPKGTEDDILHSVFSSQTKDAGAVFKDKIKPLQDVDVAFRETVTRAITKFDVKKTPERLTLDDQNKTFRTRWVVLWVLSNAALAIAIGDINVSEAGDMSVHNARLYRKQDIYLTTVLYLNFGLSAFRFAGVCSTVYLPPETSPDPVSFKCIYYLFMRNLCRICRRN